MTMKHLTSTFALLGLFLSTYGQAPTMADEMRADGKIYVVVGVIVLIFIVLFAYMIYLDVKLRKIENEKEKP